MTSAELIRIVARREVRERATNRTFLISTAISLVALLGLVLAAANLGVGGELVSIGVLGDPPAGLEAALSATGAEEGVEAAAVPVPDRVEAERALEAGVLDAVLDLSGQRPRILVEDDLDPLVRRVVARTLARLTLAQRLGELGIAPGDAPGLLAPPPELEVVTPDGSTEDDTTGQAIAFLATVLLFLAIQTNAGVLLTATLEERASRVVEVLLGTLRPWQLLTGKLVAMTALAMAQLAALIVVGLAANALLGAVPLPPATGAVIVASVGSLVFGFLLYAAVFAVAGSMATSVEDAQSTAAPLSFFAAGAYAVVIIGVVPNPDGVLARILTLLPPTAPFTVPARVALGSIGAVELALAAVLTLATTVVTVRLAGRLYSAAVLSGGRLTWREVVRAEPTP